MERPIRKAIEIINSVEDEHQRFVHLVTEMRREQRAFFSTHKQEHLFNSKRLEEEVDKFLKPKNETKQTDKLF